MEQRVVISKNLHQELAMAISECEHDKLFVLVDETTEKKCWPLIKDFLCLREANLITIKADDTNKTLESVSHVWSELQRMRATRHSCMINLGGGMVTDLGGFAASTFKRGIDFINIPTTLLAMVDASVGGKTGINFGGLKNEIGVFNDSKFVILDTHFLQTLDRENILSGYAEMLKHGLISNEKMWAELIGFMDESLWFMDDSQDKKQQATINHKLRQRRPQGAWYSESPECGPHYRPCLREFCHEEGGTYSPRLCHSLRHHCRTLPECREMQLPARQIAPDRKLHP